MQRLYAAMDMHVLASHREGFPRSPMEAAAMGLPVVATDIRGCRQVVDDGVTGRLVPVRDARALAAAIASSRADPELRRRIRRGRAARRPRATSTIAVASTITLETYRRLLGRRAAAVAARAS